MALIATETFNDEREFTDSTGCNSKECKCTISHFKVFNNTSSHTVSASRFRAQQAPPQSFIVSHPHRKENSLFYPTNIVESPEMISFYH